jgi:prevent-host-death family protein
LDYFAVRIAVKRSNLAEIVKIDFIYKNQCVLLNAVVAVNVFCRFFNSPICCEILHFIDKTALNNYYNRTKLIYKEVKMQISLTELKNNTGKYVVLADKEDIFVTKNGRQIAKITNTKVDKREALKSFIGIISGDIEIDLDKMRTERIMNKNQL